MNINTQLTSRAAVQDPSSGNAATSGFQCRETNQDYPLRAFSEVCLWEIPGLIQLVTEINPYSRWSTCSLSLGTWVQIPRAHKVRCCSVHLYPQCFYGGLGVEIGDSWEAQGPAGDSVSRRTEREKRWLDCPLTSTKSHDLQGPHNYYYGIQASAHILGLLLSLSCFPQQVLKQNLKQKSAFPFRDQNSRSKHRFTLWSVNITVF